MNSEDVAELYQTLHQTGIAIWIDGGWAVDAVAGRQTRPHNDLDIAVEAEALDALRRFLAERGYRQTPSKDASKWNFVLEDEDGRKIDVHVTVLHEQGGVWSDAVDGIAYPAGSLTGEGIIAGTTVRCISAELQLRFKTSYPPRTIDRQDVAVLCGLLGRPVPDTHKQDAP
jgi:lincosamide nucleotidyltransferase A/C/D/E